MVKVRHDADKSNVCLVAGFDWVDIDRVQLLHLCTWCKHRRHASADLGALYLPGMIIIHHASVQRCNCDLVSI